VRTTRPSRSRPGSARSSRSTSIGRKRPLQPVHFHIGRKLLTLYQRTNYAPTDVAVGVLEPGPRTGGGRGGGVAGDPGSGPARKGARAAFSDRAAPAPGRPRGAQRRAELHERLIAVCRAARRQQLGRARRRLRRAQPSAVHPLYDAPDVDVHRRDLLAEGERRNGGRRVGAYAGQRAQPRGVARPAALRDRLGGVAQGERPPVVTERDFGSGSMKRAPPPPRRSPAPARRGSAPGTARRKAPPARPASAGASPRRQGFGRARVCAATADRERTPRTSQEDRRSPVEHAFTGSVLDADEELAPLAPLGSPDEPARRRGRQGRIRPSSPGCSRCFRAGAGRRGRAR